MKTVQEIDDEIKRLNDEIKSLEDRIAKLREEKIAVQITLKEDDKIRIDGFVGWIKYIELLMDWGFYCITINPPKKDGTRSKSERKFYINHSDIPSRTKILD